MKRSAFMAFLLTLLMAVLVLSAALLFMWQGRQTLVDQQSNMQAEATRLNDELLSSQANGAVEAAARATLQADWDASQQDIVNLQMALDELEVVATSAAVTPESPVITPIEEVIDMSPPVAEIVYPRLGQYVETGNSEVVAYANHPQGIAEAVLSLNGEPINTFNSIDGQFSELIETSISIDLTGTYTLSLVATSLAGVTSEPHLVWFEVISATQEASGIEGLVEAPFIERVSLLVIPFAYLWNEPSG